MRRLKPFLLLLLLLPIPAWAGENAIFREYYTWGGTIDVVREAFQKLALIMSDQRYVGLFFGIAVIGILIASLGLIIHGWVRGHAPTWGWMELLVTLLVAGTVYFGFIKKRDTLYIYDETTNEMTAVSGVPDGAILLAGFFNRIEKGLIDLIDTTNLSGLSYRDGTGGVALQLLVDGSLAPLGEQISPTYLNMTLAKYFEDCWLFNMSLGYANPSGLYNPPNNDIRDTLAQGSHPSVYTVWYDQTHPGGVTATCEVVWNGGQADDGSTIPGLKTLLNAYSAYAAPVMEYLRQICAGVGFDVSNDAVVNRCRQLFEATLARLMTRGANQWIPNGGVDGYLRARIAANAIYTALDRADPSTQIKVIAQRQLREAGIGIAITANRYIPALKAAVTAIFLGILPVLLIFIFTPVWKKVLGAAVGAFAFLCFWGVSDALVHSFVINRVTLLFRDVQALGIDAVLVKIPKNALDAMSLFGIMRTASMFLAGLMASIVFKFGGYMLAHLASHVVGMVQGAALRGAEVAFKPEVRGEMLEKTVDAVAKGPAVRWAAEATGGFDALLVGKAQASALNTTASVFQAQKLQSLYGPTPFAAQAVANSQAMRVLEGASKMRTRGEIAETYGVSTRALTELEAAWNEWQKAGDAAQFHRVVHDHFHGDYSKAALTLSEMKVAPLEGLIQQAEKLGVPPQELRRIEGALEAEKLLGGKEYLDQVPPGTYAQARLMSMLRDTAKMEAVQQVAKQYGLAPYDLMRLQAATEEWLQTGQATELKSVVQNTFGGDWRKATETLAALKFAPLEGFVRRANELGLNPQQLAEIEGVVKAERDLGHARYLEGVPAGTLARVEAFERLNELAKYISRRALGEVMTSGVPAQTEAYLRDLTQVLRRNPQLYREFMANLHAHVNDLNFQVGSLEDAEKLWKFLEQRNPALIKEFKSMGMKGPEDLVNKSVTIGTDVVFKGETPTLVPLWVQGAGGIDLAKYRRYVEDAGRFTGPAVLDVVHPSAAGKLENIQIGRIVRQGDLASIEAYYKGTPLNITAPGTGVIEYEKDGKTYIALSGPYLPQADPAALYESLKKHPELFREVFLPAMLQNPQAKTEILNELSEQLGRFATLSYGQQSSKATQVQFETEASAGLSGKVVDTASKFAENVTKAFTRTGTKGMGTTSKTGTSSTLQKITDGVLDIEVDATVRGMGDVQQGQAATVHAVRAYLERVFERHQKGEVDFVKTVSEFAAKVENYAQDKTPFIISPEGDIKPLRNPYAGAASGLKEGVWDYGLREVQNAMDKGIRTVFKEWVWDSGIQRGANIVDQYVDKGLEKVKSEAKELLEQAGKKTAVLADESLRVWREGVERH